MKERQAAKLLRKRQLAELRAKAGSRATGEERRKVERDKEAEERKRWEGEELERMRREEAAQLSGGDRCALCPRPLAGFRTPARVFRHFRSFKPPCCPKHCTGNGFMNVSIPKCALWHKPAKGMVCFKKKEPLHPLERKRLAL